MNQPAPARNWIHREPLDVVAEPAPDDGRYREPLDVVAQPDDDDLTREPLDIVAWPDLEAGA